MRADEQGLWLDGRSLGGRHQRHLKMSEVIARQLAQYIAEQDFPEGSMLPSEGEMRESFGVGRTTLREALRLLETQGVITIKAGPRGGPVVRTPQAQDLCAGLTLQLQLHHASLGTLVDARILIEPPAAGAAAKSITPEELADLEANVQEFRDTIPLDKATLLSSCEHFHGLVARASRNIVMEVFVASLLAIYDAEEVGLSYDLEQQQEALHSHEAVVAALRAEDSTAAEEAMRNHLTTGLKNFRDRFPQLLDTPVRWV